MIGLSWHPSGQRPHAEAIQKHMHSRGMAAMSGMLLPNMPRDMDRSVDKESLAKS